MSKVTKEKAPATPAVQPEGATPEPQEKKPEEPPHHHVHHDHVISPASTSRSYLNPGAISFGR